MESEIKALEEKSKHWENQYKEMHSLWNEYYLALMNANKRIEELEGQLDSSEKEAKNIVDKANQEIEKANQDQIKILDAVNEAKEEIINY